MEHHFIVIMTAVVAMLMASSNSAMHDDPPHIYRVKTRPQLKNLRPDRQQRRLTNFPRNKTKDNNNNGCPTKCMQCSPYNGCITCRPRHFLLIEWQNMRQAGICVAQCPQGYYHKVWNPDERRARQQGKCSKCTIDNCERCRTKERCGRCIHPYLLHRGRCLKKCPPKALLFHPEERRCRKPGHVEECRPTPWSPWSRCLFKRGTSQCIGFQTRSRSFVYRFNSWGGNNLLRNLDYELKMTAKKNGKKVKRNIKMNDNLLKRSRKSLYSSNDLPLGSRLLVKNVTLYDLALYQKFKLNEVIKCPDPEYDYKKCYRKAKYCGKSQQT